MKIGFSLATAATADADGKQLRPMPVAVEVLHRENLSLRVVAIDDERSSSSMSSLSSSSSAKDKSENSLHNGK